MGNCEAEVKALGTNAINNAANTVITKDTKYEDMFTVVTNDSGNIVMVQANSPNINRMAREIANLTQANLEALGEQSVEIAFGTFTGVSLLMGFGPLVEIKFAPIGAANCDFVSEFTSAGINQTLHKIYINITADISAITSIYDLNVSVVAEILICENLLIGEIPDTYLSVGKLDLTP